jgi:GntR family transcriptional regulator
MVSPRKRLLPFQLDFHARLPVYLQIIRQVQRLASSGRLQPGDQLPTVRQLAAQLGVNFNTVARAYRGLGQAGIVSPQPGRGTFVLQTGRAGRARALTLQTLASQFIAEARRSNFTEAQIVAMVARRLKLEASLHPAGESHG